MKTEMDKIKMDLQSNITTTALISSNLDQIKSELSDKIDTTIWPTLPAAANTQSTTTVKNSVHPTSVPSIDDIATELKRRDEKRLNIIVFGLSPSDDLTDEEMFDRLITDELGFAVHTTKLQRLGKGSQDKSAPLLVCLRDEQEKRRVLSNAKKLRESKSPVIKTHVYINADLTLQERQHRNALREELKLRKTAGEQDIGIRAGKIVHISKKE
jgi:hypothetical protein